MGLFNVGLPQPTSAPTPAGLPVGVFDIQGSTSYTAPCDGWLDILAFGAGGSGGVAFNSVAGATRALGGCAGGTCFKRVKVRAGTVLTFTLGAGGVGVARSTTGATPGNPGGTTTITSSAGLTLTIPGGAGGLATQGAVTALSHVAAVLPTGGGINLAGGIGGSISANAATVALSTGGGGPRISSGTADSGSITGAVTDLCCTGGAGASTGSGGVPTASSANTGGGGAGAPSPTGSASPGPGTVQTPLTSANVLGYLAVDAAGTIGVSSGSSALVAGFGGGSGASSSAVDAAYVTGAVVFGGSGALALRNTNPVQSTGTVTWVGGSGGIASSVTPGGTHTSGRGGNALVLAAFYPRGA